MKWLALASSLILLIGLVSDASAVKLEYNRFFPECSFKDNTLEFFGVIRCGCYFFVPNWHMEAGYDLTVRATGEGVWQLMFTELNYTISFFDFLNPTTMTQRIASGQLPIDVGQFISFSFWSSKVQTLFAITLAPFLLVFDVLAGVIAYLLLLMFEFVKTYLFWFVLPVGSVNLMFYCIAVLNNQKYTPFGGFLTNPLIMGLLIAVLMIVGTIILVSLDFTIFNIPI
jgi:hypothetical protein